MPRILQTMPISLLPNINLAPLGTAALLPRFDIPELRVPSSCSDFNAATPRICPITSGLYFPLDSVAHIWTFSMQQDERGHGINGRGSRWLLFTNSKETSGHGHWVWGLGGKIRQPSSSSLFIPDHWDHWTLRIPGEKTAPWSLCFKVLPHF